MLCEKTLANYIRLSMEDGDMRKSVDKKESNSVSNQRKLLLDYYKNHSDLQRYKLMEFCDDGFSGTNFERPQFREMMEKVKRGQIHCILVKDLSRFGRDFLEVGAYLELVLPLFGTRFISVNDAFDSNHYLGTTGGMELALHNLINGLYSKDLSVKVRSAVKTRNQRGLYCGGAAFYGYKLDPKDKHHLVADEEVRAVIVNIFEMCVDGMSTMQIAKELNAKGIPCPSEYKRRKGINYNGRTLEETSIWIGGTVRRILTDERYTGKMISGTREMIGIRSNKMKRLPKDEWIIVEGTHEAIISQELFDSAAESLRARIKTVNSNTAGDRFDNLFVCGFCGRKLQKSQGKKIHLYCMKERSVANSECGHIHEDWDQLKSAVLRVLNVHIKMLCEKTERFLKSNTFSIDNLQERIRKDEKKAAVLRNRKTALYEAYRSGQYSREEFVEMKNADEKMVVSLEKEIEESQQSLDRILKQNETATKILSDVAPYSKLSEYDPKIIRRFVDEIKVFGNENIEIVFRNTDMYVFFEKDSKDTEHDEIKLIGQLA